LKELWPHNDDKDFDLFKIEDFWYTGLRIKSFIYKFKIEILRVVEKIF